MNVNMPGAPWPPPTYECDVCSDGALLTMSIPGTRLCFCCGCRWEFGDYDRPVLLDLATLHDKAQGIG